MVKRIEWGAAAPDLRVIEGWYNSRRLHSTLGYLSANNDGGRELGKEE
jgi:transposase InsO family protein